MPYEPKSLESAFTPFEEEGWYRLILDTAEPMVSKGGYPGIKMQFLVTDGECEGNKVFYDMLIPPLEKAYRMRTDESGKQYLDRNSQTYWLLRVGWVLQVFGIHIDQGDEKKNVQNLALEKNLQKVCTKIAHQEAVGFIKPGTYEKAITDKETGEARTETRKKGDLTEIRAADYQPKEGFVSEFEVRKPIPVDTGADTSMLPSADDPELDEDINLEEDEEFFAD